MGASFATVDDFRRLYDSAESDARLQALLDRASRDIASELRASGVTYDASDDDFAADLADVACAMVKRTLPDDADEIDTPIPYGSSQVSQTGGPYAFSATLANPYGDMFITKAEKRKLGIGRARAGFSPPV